MNVRQALAMADKTIDEIDYSLLLSCCSRNRLR